eukprot:Rmarinus@m.15593
MWRNLCHSWGICLSLALICGNLGQSENAWVKKDAVHHVFLLPFCDEDIRGLRTLTENLIGPARSMTVHALIECDFSFPIDTLESRVSVISSGSQTKNFLESVYGPGAHDKGFAWLAERTVRGTWPDGRENTLVWTLPRGVDFPSIELYAPCFITEDFIDLEYRPLGTNILFMAMDDNCTNSISTFMSAELGFNIAHSREYYGVSNYDNNMLGISTLPGVMPLHVFLGRPKDVMLAMMPLIYGENPRDNSTFSRMHSECQSLDSRVTATEIFFEFSAMPLRSSNGHINPLYTSTCLPNSVREEYALTAMKSNMLGSAKKILYQSKLFDYETECRLISQTRFYEQSLPICIQSYARKPPLERTYSDIVPILRSLRRLGRSKEGNLIVAGLISTLGFSSNSTFSALCSEHRFGENQALSVTLLESFRLHDLPLSLKYQENILCSEPDPELAFWERCEDIPMEFRPKTRSHTKSPATLDATLVYATPEKDSLGNFETWLMWALRQSCGERCAVLPVVNKEQVASYLKVLGWISVPHRLRSVPYWSSLPGEYAPFTSLGFDSVLSAALLEGCARYAAFPRPDELARNPTLVEDWVSLADAEEVEYLYDTSAEYPSGERLMLIRRDRLWAVVSRLQEHHSHLELSVGDPVGGALVKYLLKEGVRGRDASVRTCVARAGMCTDGPGSDGGAMDSVSLAHSELSGTISQSTSSTSHFPATMATLSANSKKNFDDATKDIYDAFTCSPADVESDPNQPPFVINTRIMKTATSTMNMIIQKAARRPCLYTCFIKYFVQNDVWIGDYNDLGILHECIRSAAVMIRLNTSSSAIVGDIELEEKMFSPLPYPLLMSAHISFFPPQNFSDFISVQPKAYISLMRDPISRARSFFEHTRSGKARSWGYSREPLSEASFSECVAAVLEGRPALAADCMGLNSQLMYLCGNHPSCFDGSREGLERAKNNIKSHYVFVGITERLDMSFYVLENLLPSFFKGTTHKYAASQGPIFNPSKYTKTRETLSLDVKQQLTSWNDLDFELYEWVSFRMHAMYDVCKKKNDGKLNKLDE